MTRYSADNYFSLWRQNAETVATIVLLRSAACRTAIEPKGEFLESKNEVTTSLPCKMAGALLNDRGALVTGRAVTSRFLLLSCDSDLLAIFSTADNRTELRCTFSSSVTAVLLDGASVDEAALSDATPLGCDRTHRVWMCSSTACWTWRSYWTYSERSNCLEPSCPLNELNLS